MNSSDATARNGPASAWLDVPLAEYEAHMTAPEVAQLETLADLFDHALRRCRPESVAILGVAGGNGLERIDPSVTRRVVGVDIHPAYLAAIRDRFAALPGLELLRADLANDTLTIAPVSLVHAALVFEHAGTSRCLDNAVAMIAPGGWLSVVLQLPSGTVSDVAPTRFASIRGLASAFTLVEPDSFVEDMLRRGYEMVDQTRRTLTGGKALWMSILRSARGGDPLPATSPAALD